MGGRDLPLKQQSGSPFFFLFYFNAAKPGAHCGLRLPKSVELLGHQYRYFFCEDDFADAPRISAHARDAAAHLGAMIALTDGSFASAGMRGPRWR